MKPSHARLYRLLRDAFPTEPINPEGAFDQWGTTYLDANPYMEQIRGKSWERLDREYIIRRSDALGFLGTRHLIAVLPVYLLAMVEDGVWSPATGMLTLILAKPREEDDMGLGRERFDALAHALTAEQLKAVAWSIQIFAKQDPEGSLGRSALVALEGYWKKYLPADK